MEISRGCVIENFIHVFLFTVFIFQLNILVDQARRARLADFGLLTVISDSKTLTSRLLGGTTRWMSPELLDPEIQDHRRTIDSDCYALGMVIYEVLSERVPFHQSPEWAIPGKVSNGDRPERPQGAEGAWFADDVWKVLGRCWMPQPGDRPSVRDVLQCLEKVSRSWIPAPVSSTTGLPTEAPSDTVAVDSTDAGRMSPPSHVAPHRPSIRQDPEEAAETVNVVRCVTSTSSSINLVPRQTPPNDLRESPSIRTNDPSPTQGLLGGTVGRVIPGANDPGSGDNRGTFPGLTARHNAKSAARGNHGPATSASSFLMKVANWDGESRDIDQVLTAAFNVGDYPACIKDLRAQQIDPLSYINNVDKVRLHLIQGSPSSITAWS